MKTLALICSLICALTLPTIPAQAASKTPKRIIKVKPAVHQKNKHKTGTVNTAKEAKAIAEQETGGIPVSTRRIPLNGASSGWEVEVRMPKEERGWKCIIDSDTRMIYTKDRIPNPIARKRK